MPAPSRSALPRRAAARAGVLAATCRAAGLAPTPQRLAIYETLRASLDHPSPEGVYARVRERVPSLSLATVYKTLEALVDAGLAAEVPATGKTKRYDGNMDPHHHLICARCHEVRDVYHPDLDGVRPPARLPGFVAQRVSVHIHGLCEPCSRATRSR